MIKHFLGSVGPVVFLGKIKGLNLISEVPSIF